MAFSLPLNEVSGIVETDFGYHIIKVTDKKSSRNVPLEELKERIKKALLPKKVQAEMNAWLKDLQSKAKIEIMY